MTRTLEFRARLYRVGQTYPRSGPLDARPGATRSGGEPPSLDALVRDPARVADLSTEERASVLIQIAGLAAALAVPPPASAAPGTDEYLKVQDVADELQVSRGTVYELVRTGRLPSVAVGKSKALRVPRRALAALMALDTRVSETYSRGVYDRHRTPPPPPPAQAHATRTRRPARRPRQQPGAPGARGARDTRVAGAATQNAGGAIDER